MFKSASREPSERVGHLIKGSGLSGGLAVAPPRGKANRTLAQARPSLIPADFVLDEQGFYKRYGKRFLDMVVSAAALTVLLPFLPVVALAIRLSSPGPIFYRSIRLGKNGRPFIFYKFRSMVADAHENRTCLLAMNEVDGPVFKISNDPRVTRIGRLLRRTSVDELPQLVNVLRGDMTLVGPRPPIPEEVEKYEPWQRRRLDVKPGITCLWQISGRSKLGFNEWMRLDLQYIQHRSFRLDMKILLRTIPAVLSRDGAY
jgi:exopolysaccharide biosynthesis polyprenyl glycosylphosphotransferase